ncbi:DNA-processing protein DprA [Candidatus Formimonas warabiya]|uniref:DNA protecting protein DprA n=1 Tax=Formimonas warabiya TaxID=1761012 RepID=A0A3G1KPZ5_FORW1|nr:DNA-processing protein DprA [Candidatus Formimonas warabiya]ATW24549.1 DNA protecting protein DprA [Candidatus Formimonas warabiya]
MDPRELKYLLALYSLPGMGQRHLKLLIDYFQSSEYAWQQSDLWERVPGWTGHDRRAFTGEGLGKGDVERVYENFLKSGAQALTLQDDAYPLLLRNIYDPPYVLFYRGTLPGEGDLCVALVGSRKATAYGRFMAETMAQGLGEKNVWVVSGMARGIDTWGHQGCLKAGGKTLAVLGSGVDVVYPRENRGLYEQIIASGAVLSELPLGTPPLAQHFPARNRIISGLSRGVIVVEAAEKSGSLITVDFALEQGRDVFAVPGPVTSALSKGTHHLIRQGAKLVEKAADVLEEYMDDAAPASARELNLFSFSQTERSILELLQCGTVHFDVLAEQSGLSASELAALLTLWEIKGLIRQIPGKYYSIGSVLSEN